MARTIRLRRRNTPQSDEHIEVLSPSRFEAHVTIELSDSSPEHSEFPSEWVTTPLAQVSDFITKGATPTTYGFRWVTSGVLFLRSECVAEHGLDLTQSMAISEEAHSTLRRSAVREGDLLVTITGNVGRTVQLTGVAEANINQHIARVRIRGADAGFVYHFLSQPSVRKRFNSIVTGQAYPQISLQQVRNVPIALPPLPEQRAIAAALSDVDALLASLDRFIAKQRDLKQAAMQQLLTGEKRLPGFGGKWETKRLGEAADLTRDQCTPASHPAEVFHHFSLPAFDAGATPVVENGATILSNKFVMPAGAILVSKLNPRIPRVWTPIEIPRNSIASTEFLVLVPRRDVDRGYLAAVCSSNAFGICMELGATGTTGSHQRIHPSDALTIPVTIPRDLREQAAIASVLSDMDAKITALEARREKTRLLKQGMMQELLTGRTRLV